MTQTLSRASAKKPAARSAKTQTKPPNKFERIIAMLRRPEGASVAQLAEMTGWKTNSVRGVLAGAMKSKFGLTITSEKPDKVRIYRTGSGPAH
jgi:hypothetical protein